MKLMIKEYFDDDDNYLDSDGYLTEDHADYLECGITISLATFADKTSVIREYIIEDVLRTRDCNKISLHDYKMHERRKELVVIDGTPYNFDGQEVVDLTVRFVVDENGEYDFSEYVMDESIRKVTAYLNDAYFVD